MERNEGFPPRTEPEAEGAKHRRSLRALKPLKTATVAIVAVAVVAIVYVIFWFSAASFYRQAITDWAEERRADGYAVQFSRLTLGGFPFMLRGVIDDPMFGAPNRRRPWTWKGRHLIVEARPWQPRRIRLLAAGNHRLDIGGGSGSVAYRGSAAVMTAEVAIDDGSVNEGRAWIEELTLSAENHASAFAVGKARIEARRDPRPDADYRTVTYELAVDAESLELPRAFSLPLGRRVTQASLRGAVMGRIPPGLSYPSLAQWRDDGGTIEIERLDLVYGPLVLHANGTLALDDDMQPVGAFTAKLQGFFEAVDALGKAGYVGSRQAIMAKVVLAALAKRPADGGRATLNVPLTLQERRLYVGPVNLTEVPPIRWASGPKR